MTDAGHHLISADAEQLHDLLPVDAGALRTRRVLKADGATLVRLTLDGGQVMTEHHAAVPLLVQVLSGRIVFSLGEERLTLDPGAVLHVDGGVRHAVEALSEAHVLLTMLTGRAAAPARATTPAQVPSETSPAAEQAPHPQGRPHLVLAEAAPDSPQDYPELDVRDIPHSIRHAAVIGALGSIPDGWGLILIAPHNPLPLLREVEDTFPGRFSIEYLLREPRDWRVQLLARAAA